VRRRPARSATRPAGTSAAANAIAYAVIVHDSAGRETPWNVFPIAGSTALAMETSIETTKPPTIVIAMTGDRRRGRRHATSTATLCVLIASPLRMGRVAHGGSAGVECAYRWLTRSIELGAATARAVALGSATIANNLLTIKLYSALCSWTSSRCPSCSRRWAVVRRRRS
jgi:hypothetical protein